MDDHTKKLKGSESRDRFKQKHKELDRRLYGCDADFIFVESGGPVAYIDYKKRNDKVTWAEHQVYSYWAKDRPVYIVQGNNIDDGVFVIMQYINKDQWKDGKADKVVARTSNWDEFESWEFKVRGLTK